MSGHSKWASIKHKKAQVDARRGKLFTKIIREITVAARNGGSDLESNARLRTVVDKAKAANMPRDNIEKAIKKGTGEIPGASYEEVVYEGYGPAGVAIMVEVLTDNKNRTTAEIRSIFTKKGGNLAGAGSVGWIFSKKGLIVVSKSAAEEDALMAIVLDAGAEDLSDEGDAFHIITPPQNLDATRKALEQAGIKPEVVELTLMPGSTVSVSDKSRAAIVLGLVESLEEQDDSQNVYANFDIPDDVLAEAAA